MDDWIEKAFNVLSLVSQRSDPEKQTFIFSKWFEKLLCKHRWQENY